MARLLNSLLLVAAAVASLGFGGVAERQTDETLFDPRPRPGPMPRGEKRSGDAGDRLVSYELSGFAAGQPVHARLLPFCRRVNRELATWDRNGWRIDRIVVRGYADGIPNHGLRIDPAHLPVECHRRAERRVDDIELARLRACLVKESLFSASGAKYPAGVQWTREAFDEPDGGATGPEHRKVKVEISLAKDRS